MDIKINPEFEYKQIKGNRWQISKTLNCLISIENQMTFNYTIGDGFTTDFRSGPKALNNFIDKIGNLGMCWLIHDVNYEGFVSQKIADNLLFHMLLYFNVPRIKAETIHLGLRLFGIANYNKESSEQVKKFVGLKHAGKTNNIINKKRNKSMPVFEENNKAILIEEEPFFEKENYEYVKKNLQEIAKSNDLVLDEDTIDECYGIDKK